MKSSNATTWLILPAFNEERALPILLDSLIRSFREAKENFWIIIVDDGSTDRTGQIALEYAQQAPTTVLRHSENAGLAETIRHGLMEAVGRAQPEDVLVTMDADNTHPANLVLTMLEMIRAGDDVVIASRYQRGSQLVGVPWHRRFLSWAASWLFRIFLPIRGVRDYTCGYRAYRADVMKRLIDRHGEQFITERGFSCMLDILLRLRESELRFAEVPLTLRYDLKPGRSQMRIFSTIVDSLKLLVRRRFGSD
jgi:dolichol-phosphate mannosyltransferase